MEERKALEAVTRILSVRLRAVFQKADFDSETLQEIRLRAGKPILLQLQEGEYFLAENGKLSRRAEEGYVASRAEIRETMEYISNYSLYAFEEEVRQGFITLAGGHRVGICGRVITEQNQIKSMKYISFLNIRFARQIKGCANQVLPKLISEERVCHTLLIAPPGAGKTTMLRDIVRQLSDRGRTVGIIDERSELAACYQGIPQNDVGLRTDVLDCCPKAEGMMLMIRSMAPEIIAVDEIGGREELHALHYASSCGCKLLATVHGEGLQELREKPVLKELILAGLFERYVILEKREGRCQVREILNEKGGKL